MFRHRFLCAAALLMCFGARADDGPPSWDVHLQSTYVWQLKPSFRSPYEGPQSLTGARERSYTFSATAFLGLRPWAGGEFYLNPEAVQGVPLSQVHGLGGLTNGEIQKSAGPTLKWYRARAFYRHTVGFGGGEEAVESDANQLAGSQDRRRLRITAGNLAVTDIFGTAEIAGDARTQFLNWSSLTWGHYDYAADTRGYSWGLAGEFTWDAWTLRAGRFLLPREPNQLSLDRRVMRTHGDQVELERRHGEGDRAGAVKLLVFRNVARMASYADNLPGACDLTLLGAAEQCVRRRQSKVGWGVQVEQALGPIVRVLARGGRADGRTETYAFTEIDASWFAAAQISGGLWGQAAQHVGLSLAENRLSGSHREFLRRGGLGFFLGDGTLNYRPERIAEGYWSTGLGKHAALSVGLQHISNPGYNADRGPVKVGTVRLHAEF